VLIRILGEGQFIVPDSELPEINRLDLQLEAALKSSEVNFRQALDALLDKVRSAERSLQTAGRGERSPGPPSLHKGETPTVCRRHEYEGMRLLWRRPGTRATAA